ncbi:MAG: hypothetical protein IH855_03415 [Bacteroidetes bacterium]|nr:hypothetical protein [Bacteroidota bacterium]
MPTFFVDNDLDAPDFVEPLLDAGFDLQLNREHFGHKTSDEEWIATVASNGWFAFTHDRKIARRRAQRELVLNVGLGLFIVRGKATHAVMGANVAATYPKIIEVAETHPRPFIASVTRPDRVGEIVGRVNVLWPKDP